ncbi:MAG: COX15/CtaA family protein [Thaumarchaeota archaeon]|nr:COX15/CtaA family protein [Nitrososphaerota archaeon]
MRGKDILLVLTIASLFSVIVVGAYVTVAGFGNACGSDIPQDWPGCLGGVFPPPQFAPVMEYLHRILAAFSTLFLFLTTAIFWRDSGSDSSVKKTLALASVLLVAQVLLGGVVIAQAEQAALVAAHQGLAILTFGVTVAAYAIIKRPP